MVFRIIVGGKHMKQKQRKLSLLLATLLIVLFVIIAVFLYLRMSTVTIKTDSSVVVDMSNEDEDYSLKEIIHNSQKSIVKIEASNNYQIKTGSGFLIDSEGFIVTNAHVINDADSILVKLSNQQGYFPAAVVGVGDKEDIAVIHVKEFEHHESIAIDPSYEGDIGDQVIAIGSPSEIENSVSLGLIVGTDHSFIIEPFEYNNLYQISANITHGNSGGPLVSQHSGQVIGINAAGINDTDIGFSIPLSSVYEQINEWINETDMASLNYLAKTNIRASEEELLQDVEFITEQFFQNIATYDYINSYTMLGSELQGQWGYAGFRDTFIMYNEPKIIDTRIEKQANNHYEVVVETEENDDKTEEPITFELIIGMENDQLKILMLEQ